MVRQFNGKPSLKGQNERKLANAVAGTGAKHIMTITDANLREITRKNELVLIDFWNDRCEYCRDLAPIIERLAADYAGRVAFGKLDVDKNRCTCARFKVKAYPTLLIVKNGKEVERIIGYVPREHVEAALKKQLNIANESEKSQQEGQQNL
jgi:thioredoxin 1